jgi:hypothetical protein
MRTLVEVLNSLQGLKDQDRSMVEVVGKQSFCELRRVMDATAAVSSYRRLLATLSAHS